MKIKDDYIKELGLDDGKTVEDVVSGAMQRILQFESSFNSLVDDFEGKMHTYRVIVDRRAYFQQRGARLIESDALHSRELGRCICIYQGLGESERRVAGKMADMFTGALSSVVMSGVKDIRKLNEYLRKLD